MLDLLIKKGHLLDPSQNIDFFGEIGIESGKIVSISESIKDDATTIIDAKGAYVTPGWIDVHTHIFEYGTPNGMPMDIAAIPMGVTALADAGSSGVANYRVLLNMMKQAKIRSKLILNVSACGIVMPSQIEESLDPSRWEFNRFKDAFDKDGEHIMGLKLRLSKKVAGEFKLEPLKKAVEIAGKLDTKVVVHVTDGPAPMYEIADILRPGDVFCHVYHGSGHTIFDEKDNIYDGIIKARERGVIFDAAAGRGNFSYKIAKKAISSGFLPDSISTDETLQNMTNAMAGPLPIMMSRYLALGLSFKDIIERVTSLPAKQFGDDQIGSLKVGNKADITICKVESSDIVSYDKFGDYEVLNDLIVPKATIIDGQLLYHSLDCQMIK